MPCSLATSVGDAPATKLCAAIICFCSVVQRRRRSPRGIKSIRRVGALLRLVVCTLSDDAAAVSAGFASVSMARIKHTQPWKSHVGAAQRLRRCEVNEAGAVATPNGRVSLGKASDRWEIGGRIKSARQRAGLTQRALAKKLAVSAGAVGQWGDRRCTCDRPVGHSRGPAWCFAGLAAGTVPGSRRAGRARQHGGRGPAVDRGGASPRRRSPQRYG